MALRRGRRTGPPSPVIEEAADLARRLAAGMGSAAEPSPPGVIVRRLSTSERSPRWRQRLRLREGMARSLVLVPGCYLLAAAVLGILVPEIDRRRGRDAWLDLDPDSARSILEAVATGMITFSGLVVSIAVLVIQFGAGQYSPRLVLVFRRDPLVKHALGLFVVPGLYSLVAVSAIGGSDSSVRPDLTVIVALILMVAALIALFRFIARLLDLLRPRRIYAHLAGQALVAIDDVYPVGLGEEAQRFQLVRTPVTSVIANAQPGAVLAAIDRAGAVRVAADAGVVVEVALPVGGHLPRGAPLFRVHGEGRVDEAELRDCALFSDGRTITQDPAFAIRAMVDVACRALSPAVNDPTTAVECLDGLEGVLLALAGRRLEGSAIVDGDGTVRVLLPTPGWEELLTLALTEIRHYGAEAPQVMRRFRALLQELERAAPEARGPELARQMVLLEAAVERGFPDPAERAIARVPDRVGLGSGVQDWV